MSSSTVTSPAQSVVPSTLSREDRIRRLAIQSVPAFKNTSPEDLLVKVISGGITNFLYGVYPRDAAIRQHLHGTAASLSSLSHAPTVSPNGGASVSPARAVSPASLPPAERKLLKSAADNNNSSNNDAPSSYADADDAAHACISGHGLTEAEILALPIPKMAVVVRVYGKDTERIISRNEELFWQSQFLHTFAKNHEMLVYEFLYGFRPMDYAELMPRYEEIADKLAELHVKATSTAIFHSAFGSPSSNHSLIMLTQWCQMVSDTEAIKKHIKPEDHARFDSLGWGSEGLEEECGFLLSIINNHAPELPTAVCHNDLLSANIMVNDGKKEMQFIDFEYMRLNYVYFDIANHFNEYAGLDCDYEKYFPNREHCEKFVREYLSHGRRQAAMTAVTRSMDDETSQALLSSIARVGTKEVRQATDLVLFFTLVSNITWAMWSIIQAQSSEIDFDYVGYAIIRYNRYLATKQEYTKNL